MATPNQKQKRLQIIFLALIGITVPCYALGYTFLAVNRRVRPTATTTVETTPSFTPAPLYTSTPEPIIPTRFPTFTPSHTPTITNTPTASQTASLTPSLTFTPLPTDTPTSSPTFTSVPATLAPTEEPSPIPTE